LKTSCADVFFAYSMDSVPLAAIDKALRATVAEGDLSHGKLLKDRLEWVQREQTISPMALLFLF